MNYFEAKLIAEAILNESENPDLWDTPGKIVLALNVIEDENEYDYEDDIELIHAVYDKAPGLLNYDAKGNWVGEVKYENGYTNN